MNTPRLSQQPLVAGDHDSVMHQFQQLMSQFLQTQALVMTAYLQGESNGHQHHLLPQLQSGLPAAAIPPALEAASRSASAQAAPAAAPALPRTQPPPAVVVAASVATVAGGNGKHTGGEGSHAAAAVAASAPASASVILPAPLATAITMPAPAPVPVATSKVADGNGSASTARLTEAEVLMQLVRIVSDRTGYPEDMLAPDANIEADLGIDSIKRMEILAAFQEAHGGGASDSFQQSLERLTAMKTLRESAATIVEIFAAPVPAAAV